MAPSRSATSEPSVARHRFAIVTAAATFILVIAGGLVTSTGSGLAVPDWPLSYGMLFPPMIGGILYEHGHRMIAGTVALLTAALMIWTWRRESRTWVRWLAVIAFVAVILQAVLGGLTVIFLLPTPISVGHAGVAQLFFVGVVSLALVTSPRWQRATAAQVSSTALRRMTLIALIALYGQLLLGAWVRHTGSALAIPDFPLAFGALIPPLSAGALDTVNRVLTIDMNLPRIESMSQVAIHFVHRVGAIAVTGVIVALLVATLRHARGERLFVGLAATLTALIVVQGMLGAVTVWTRRSVPVATAHVAVGALMLAVAAAFALAYRRTHIVELMEVRSGKPGVSEVPHQGSAHA